MNTQTEPTPDFEVSRFGNLFTCVVKNDKAMAWVKENVQLEAWAWLGKCAFVVDQHYIRDLVQGMRDAGFQVV